MYILEYLSAGSWSVALGIVCIFADMLFVKRLENRHHAEWERLKRPGLLHNDFELGSHLLRLFLIRGEFLRLADPLLSALGIGTLLSGMLTIVAFTLSLSGL